MRAILAALAAVLLIAPGGWAAPKDDTLIIAFKSETPTMDPHTESSQMSNQRNRWVIQTIMHRTPEGKLVPLLAKSHRWIDPKTLEIELRPGVKFSNGEDLDAHAVKYSLERIHDPKLKSRQIERWRMVGHKGAVEVLDKYKVRINLGFPDAGFLNRLGNMGGMVPPKYYSQHEPRFLATHQVGSGPYIMKSWVRDTETVYEANPNFWDPRYPKVKRVIVKVIPEEAARVAALVKGEVDVILDVPQPMWERIDKSGKARVVSKPGIRIFRLGFYNKWGGVLNDKRVRQAVAHAIDRKTLVHSVLRGNAVDVTQVLHPLTEGYLSPEEYPYPYEYNPEKAKRLLAQAGYANGLELDLIAGVGSYLKDKEAAEVVAGMLEKAGIRAKLTALAPRAFLTSFRKHRNAPQKGYKPFLYFFSFGGGGGDSDLQLSAVAGCKGAWSGWCDKAIDKLIDQASSQTDPEERHKHFANLTKRLSEELAFVPLYRLNATFGLSNRVEWDPRVDERIMAWEIGIK